MGDTRKSKTVQATCKHFQWLNQVKADRELSPSAFIIAFEIGQHFNRKRGGAAWPSYRTIASAVGLDEATVVRMVRRLHERGHIKIEPGKRGRGHPNRYFMVVQKGAAAHLSAEEKPASAQVLRKIKPALASEKTCASAVEPLNEPLMASPKGEAHKVERDRCANAHTPLDVAGGLEAAAPSKKEKQVSALKLDLPNASEPPKEGHPPRKNALVILHAGGDCFAELWAIWRRPWPDNEAEARRAFIEACNHSDPEVRADPLEIIERARSWVAGFPDEARFLPKLVAWLEGRGWETEPPRRRRLDYYRRGKPNTALMMADYARQLELEEARS